MTSSEIGMYCIGVEPTGGHFTDYIGDGGGVPLWRMRGRTLTAPLDITLSDPPTDAQIANVWRLREKAITDGTDAFHRAFTNNLWKRCGCKDRRHSEVVEKLAEASLEQIRDAAIDTLISDCPEEVQRAWKELTQ